MPRLNKSQRAELISRRSRELAKSGQFDDWLDIEHHLTHVEGLPEARTQLDGRAIRDLLDRLCEGAKKRHA